MCTESQAESYIVRYKYINIAVNVNDFFFNSIPITTLGKVGIGETGNIWKLKVGATIFPTEEKCKTCGGKKKRKDMPTKS